MRPDEVELGLGIHGEPGAALIPLGPIAQLAATMVASVERALAARDSGQAPIALLVNDLGGVPPIELAVATQAILDASNREVALVIGPGRLMTSLDMKGLSISAVPLDSEIEQALLSAVEPRAWIPGRCPITVAPLALPAALAPAEYAPSANASRREAVQKICGALIEKQSALDALDAKVGDGDTGTTFATAARNLLAALDGLPFADAPALCAAVSARLSRVMGGSSGILLAILVAAMGARVGDPPDWVAALRAGVERLKDYGGAQQGDRTMLDALVPALVALEAGGDLAAASRAAAEGATRTASIAKARAGRASYVRPDILLGIADPGATAIAVAFDALCAVDR